MRKVVNYLDAGLGSRFRKIQLRQIDGSSFVLENKLREFSPCVFF